MAKFAISKRSLSSRRQQCHRYMDELLTLPQANKLKCGFCGEEKKYIVASQDRYGLPFRTAGCHRCGIYYLLDHFSSEGYQKFYGSLYRNLTASFSGRQHRTPHSLVSEQRHYAEYVLAMVGDVVKEARPSSLLDVGGSTGIVAKLFAERLGCSGTVLDPSPDEIEVARSLGLNGTVGMLENIEIHGHERYDLILVCRTIEHFFDLKGSLNSIYELLSDEGLVYVDIVDYVDGCKYYGTPETVSKVDHLYWLTSDVAPIIFEAAGFEVLTIHVGTMPMIYGYLLRKKKILSAVSAPLSQSSTVAEQMKIMNDITQQWNEYSRHPKGVFETIRVSAYKTKRKAVKIYDRHRWKDV